MQPPAIYTIGYEGATVATFLQALRDAGVRLVLDIRAALVSRKKGFSKNQLAARLAAAGIGYRHLRGLGTPTRGRDAARLSKIDTPGADKPSASCMAFLDGSEKAQQQWELERRFVAFEANN